MTNDEPHLPQLDTRQDVVSGWRIFARCCTQAGQDRPPFVLVHGLSMSSRYLEPTARRLALDYRVYLPDFPGYGESQKPGRTLSVSELAGVLRDWMDFQGIGKAYLLGNSMGCQIITTFAVQNPGRAIKAVLVGPTMDPRTESAAGLFFRAGMNMLFEPVSFWPVLVHDYFEAGVRETFRALEDAIHDPEELKLAFMHTPTLVARGEHDWLVTEAWAKEVTRRLPDGKYQVIQGAAHVANYDQPDRLVKVVQAFLKDGDV